ncbi:hypothetical protein GCM10028792_18880 [Salinisphaera aquimarina]
MEIRQCHYCDVRPLYLEQFRFGTEDGHRPRREQLDQSTGTPNMAMPLVVDEKTDGSFSVTHGHTWPVKFAFHRLVRLKDQLENIAGSLRMPKNRRFNLG